MRPFVFSCDAHIAEPPDLFSSKMPPEMTDWVIHSKAEGDYGMTMIGDKVMLKIKRGLFAHKIDEDLVRRGTRDLKLRLEDMERDGVDAELCFPGLGLMAHRVEDRAAALKVAQIYNDWAWDYLDGLRDKLVPVAIIPVQNLDDGLAEFKRVAKKGYAAVMLPPVLPDGVPLYNDPSWDPIFHFAGEAEIPIIFHTGTGMVNIRAMKGPGGALFNYTRQMNDSVDVIGALVGGGVLDRNPKSHILFVEHGAGWLMGLAQRMDEVYQGHAPMIHPKLSRKPSEIVRDQVHCSFQNDVGVLMTRKGLSIDNFLFATDYPHGEGTFPHSREVVKHMFDAVPDITEEEKNAVLGLNAVKLFKHAHIKPPKDMARAA